MKNIATLIALLVSWLSVPLAVADPSPVKIMPLGDSFTSGYSVPTFLSGYRDGLYSRLEASGYDLDFLGTQVDTQNPALPDPDHEGHGGFRIDQIASNVQGWLTAVGNPDVILLIIGTNDFTQNEDPAGAPNRLGNLITQISTLRPSAKILLGNLPLRTDSASLEADQSAYNAVIPGIVSDQVLLGHQVHFVDIHSSFDASGLTSDGVHPNPAGYDAMADVWAQAIMQIIPPPATPTAILSNGSFELGAMVSASPYLEYQLDSWSESGMVSGFLGNSNCPPTNGTRMALFNGGEDTFTGTISQTFATTPGTTYRLDFNYGIIAAAGQAPRHQLLGVALTADGGGSLVTRDLPLMAIEGPVQWSPGSCLFTATTATTTLAFTDKSGTLTAGLADFSDMVLDHVRVIVAPPNSAPLADDDFYSTTAGATLVMTAPGILDGDTDVDPQTLTAVLVAGPSHGSLDLNPNGSFSYTLAGGGFTGTDSFTYKASDGTLDSNVATVSIVVTPAQPFADGSFEAGALISNSPYPQYQMDGWTVTGTPTGFPGNSVATATDGSRMALFNGASDNFTGVVSQTFATTPGESYRLSFDLGVIAAANQAPRNQLLGVAVTGEGGGSLFLQDMPLTAVEGPAQWMTRSFSFTATSPTTTLAFIDKSGTLGNVAGFSDLLLDDVQVNVATPNTAPVADDDSYGTDWNTALVVAAPGVLDGDTDVDSQALTSVPVTGPANGSLNLNPDGGFTYTPNSGFFGTDSFTYRANDGSVDSNTATVSIVVDPPGALGNGNFELGALIAATPFPQYQLNSWTVTGALCGYPGNSVASATNGSRMALINGGNDIFTDTLAQTFATTPGVTYRLRFDLGIVIAAGQTPRQQLFGVGVTAEGGGSLISQDVLLSGNEGPAQWTANTIFFTATTATTTLSFTDKSGTLGPGMADFSDMLLDHVRVDVPPPNSAPVADDDSYATAWNTALVVAAPGVLDGDTDVDLQPLTAVPVTGPANGSLILNPDGGFTYTPNSGFAGTDSFTYRANDGLLDSNLATVSIVVNPPGPLANGSFELGALISTTPFTHYQLDNWTVAGDLSGFPGNAIASATDGSRLALFNGGSDTFTGALSQTIATTPGVIYRLQFDHGIVAAAGQAPRQQLLGVAVTAEGGGSLVSQDLLLTANEGPAQWTAKSILFTATTATTTLAFTDKSGTLAPGVADFSDLLLDYVRVDVAPPNSAPVALAQSLNLNEDVPTPVTLTGSDVDGNALTFTVTAQPLHGTLSGTAPALTYTPAANYNGPDSFEFTVNDGTVDSAPATVSITVAPLNDAPLAIAQSLNLNEDVPTPVTLTGSDADGNALTFTVTTGPSHGTLSGTLPNLTYTPAANYNGPDDFSFTANDGTVDSAPATVTITVAPLNDAPLALAQSLNLDEDVPTPITLAGSDVDGTPLTFTVTTGPAHGALSGTIPNLTYTPAANYHGPDSFEFTVNDGTVDSAPATVTITVAPLDDAPLALAQSLNLDEDVPTPVTLAGSDVDGNPLTFTVTSSPSHGTLSGTLPNLTYTPAANYNGPDSFSFKVNDGTVDSAPAAVSITVAPLNDGPLADDDSYSTPWAIELVVAAPGVLDGDTDIDDPALTAVPVAGPSNGSLTLNPDGSFSYMPNIGFAGTDSFTYQANDGFLNSNTATVSIVVNPAGPLANGSFELGALISATPFPRYHLDNWTATGSPFGFVGNSVANATDGSRLALFNGGSDTFTDTLSQTVATTPGVTYHLKFDCGIVVAGEVPGQQLLGVAVSAEGGGPLVSQDLLLTGNGGPALWTAGSCTFTAISATTTLTFTDKSGTLAPGAANDSDLLLDRVQVFTNTPPLALAQSVNLDEDVPTPITLAGSDVDGTPLTFTVTTGPAHGALSGTAPNLTYTPAANYHGPDSFEFTVNDGTVDSAPAAVSITVAPLNDAPLALAQSLNLNEDVPTPVTLAGSDVDGNALTFTVTQQPLNGTLSGTLPNLTYTPAANYNGPDDFSFTANDGTVDSAPATVTITVAPLNDAPLADNDSYVTAWATALAVAAPGVLDGDTDADSPALTAVPVIGPANGSLILNPDGSFTYTPDSGFSGTDSFTYQANDGALGSNVATVSIVVNPPGPLANGSFELGALISTTPFTHYQLDSWTVAGEVSGFPGNAVATATDGVRMALFNGGSDTFTGTLSQIIATTPGVIYRLQFDHGIIAGAGQAPRQQLLEVAVTAEGGGALVFQNLPLTAGEGPAQWTARSFEFTATTATTTLAFTDKSGTLAPGVADFSDLLLDHVRMDVAPPNNPPVALAQSLNLDEDVPTLVTLTGSDLDGNPLTFTVTSGPSHGVLNGTAPNLTYTPAANYHGPDNFSFKVNDGTVDSATAAVSITVAPVADGFVEWLAGFGMTGNPGDDPDEDSTTNAVEYVIGGNPNNHSDVDLLPSVTLVSGPNQNLAAGDYLLFTYRRTQLAMDDPSTTITVQWSEDLVGTWTTVTGANGEVIVEVNNGAGDGVDLVNVHIPRPPSGRLFARLGVAIDTP